MNIAGVIMIVSVGIMAALVLFFSLRTDEKQEKKEKAVSIGMLSGEVIDIYEDNDTGLSVIAVRDKDGITQYGFSKLPAKDLEMLYSGKGCVQVPVMGKKEL